MSLLLPFCFIPSRTFHSVEATSKLVFAPCQLQTCQLGGEIPRDEFLPWIFLEDPILEATETTWIQGPLANHQVGTAESGPAFRCCLGRGCGDGSARWTGKLSQHLATGGPGWPHLSNDPCVWCLVGWKFCKIWMMSREWDPFNWMIINFCLFLSISATSMPSREWETDLKPV